jgi:hypothetical protein
MPSSPGEPIIDGISDMAATSHFGRYNSEQARWRRRSRGARRHARYRLDVRTGGRHRRPPLHWKRHRRGGTSLCAARRHRPGERPTGPGTGDVQVGRSTSQPRCRERICGTAPCGLGANGYSRTAGLSARRRRRGCVGTAPADRRRALPGATCSFSTATPRPTSHDGYYDVAFDTTQLIMPCDPLGGRNGDVVSGRR